MQPVMRRHEPGNDDDPGSSKERRHEARSLDAALGAVGSKFVHGYAQQLLTLDVAICAVVDGLRADAVGPAQVLIRLKAHVALAAKSSSDIRAFAVQRCIARYYES